MSRIGRQPIEVPQGADVTLNGQAVHVKGPKGELTFDVHPDMTVTLDDRVVTVTRPSDEPRHRALHGLTRMLVANIVEGVMKVFSKTLEGHCVGERAGREPGCGGGRGDRSGGAGARGDEVEAELRREVRRHAERDRRGDRRPGR